MGKRIMSLILSLTMIVSMCGYLPIQAYADTIDTIQSKDIENSIDEIENTSDVDNTDDAYLISDDTDITDITQNEDIKDNMDKVENNNSIDNNENESSDNINNVANENEITNGISNTELLDNNTDTISSYAAISEDTVFYVSNTGSDELNDGSYGSPFATVQHAYNFAKDSGIKTLSICIINSFSVTEPLIFDGNDFDSFNITGGPIEYNGPDISSDDNSAVIIIRNGASININNTSVDANHLGRIILVKDTSSLTITGDNKSYTNGKSTGNGAGISILDASYVEILHAGKFDHGIAIRDCVSSKFGGGVYIDNNSTLCLNASANTGIFLNRNTASLGGGVYIASNGELDVITTNGGNWNGVSTQNNIASLGNSVYVADYATLSISGGYSRGIQSQYNHNTSQHAPHHLFGGEDDIIYLEDYANATIHSGPLYGLYFQLENPCNFKTVLSLDRGYCDVFLSEYYNNWGEIPYILSDHYSEYIGLNNPGYRLQYIYDAGNWKLCTIEDDKRLVAITGLAPEIGMEIRYDCDTIVEPNNIEPIMNSIKSAKKLPFVTTDINSYSKCENIYKGACEDTEIKR